ncbi:MAG: hypothetical protein ACHWZW_15020 [Spirulina sp.]
MENRIRCENCNQRVWEGLLFCPSCWVKLLSEEDLKKNEKVWIVETEQEFHGSAAKAKFANIHDYLLIEGELSLPISTTFKARVEQARKWRAEIAKGTIVIAKTAAGEIISQVIQKPNQSQGFSQGSNLEWHKNISTYTSLFTATTTAGQDALNSLRKGEEVYNLLPYAESCTALYEANFRMLPGSSDYTIFRREQKVIEDIGDIGDSIGNGLFNTVKDVKSILDDVNAGVKRGILWFKSR